ncbi:MAG: phosphatidylserine decarboxylase [Ignavibacteria bacterium]|nr:phosphatidylserine decarboxylase [Ignavibacteria bacterium]
MLTLLFLLGSFFISTMIFVLFIVKGAFHKRFLYRDNFLLTITGFLQTIAIHSLLPELDPLFFVFIIPASIVMHFILLTVIRFYRNPNRVTPQDDSLFYAPADGQIIYIKELEQNQVPVSIKKGRMSRLNELTKTDLLQEPCYLVGITMTLFDVHINRAPMAGKVVLAQRTAGLYLGLKDSHSTLNNERNTIVIEKNNIKVGVVQIAARFVKNCIMSVAEGAEVKQGGVIGKIRVGSQADLIIPRNCDILVREGDQVFAGITPIAKLISE